MREPKTGRRRIRRALVILAVILLAAAIAVWIYLSDYYHAGRAAAAAMAPTQDVTVRATDARADFIPARAEAGLIFYPGGKVEFTAYAPLMRACAERGILCVLLRMPGNLAVLDYNAADGVAADYPEITRWYVGGHSLGGTIAATYAANHADALAGLVLLASYSTDDLTDTGLQVLSICGSADGVLNRERYDRCRANLPADAVELVIEGGCHSFFGSYGMQSGDGEPTISNDEQIRRTADAIAEMIEPNAAESAA